MSKKKIKEIIIGSNNTGKIKEIRDLLPKKYKILFSIRMSTLELWKSLFLSIIVADFISEFIYNGIN